MLEDGRGVHIFKNQVDGDGTVLPGDEYVEPDMGSVHVQQAIRPVKKTLKIGWSLVTRDDREFKDGNPPPNWVVSICLNCEKRLSGPEI